MLAEFALQYLIWHVVPASAYGKDSDFKREDAYTEDLAAHMADATKDVLGDVFTDISVETAKYEKPDKMLKLIKEFVSMGMDETSAKAMALSVQAKLASKNEAKVEETVEA